MTLNTITVTKRDGSTKSVESPYSDSEALARLEYLIEQGKIEGSRRDGTESFAGSLSTKGHRYGLSEKQAAWVHIIVVEFEAPREAPAPVAALPRLRGMIDLAGESLQFPKINLVTTSGQKVRLSRAGENSRTPGQINITDGRPFGDNTFFGKVDLEGNLLPSRAMTEEVREFLVAFDADPASVATAYGRRTGSCCFCGRELTDGRSVAVGYGPICAPRYGLPWGEERASSTVEVTADLAQGENVPALRPALRIMMER
tara:strand:- start:1383 stop:2156 length:774 start_codon:yes stop_codon:yes gene_type:complete